MRSTVQTVMSKQVVYSNANDQSLQLWWAEKYCRTQNVTDDPSRWSTEKRPWCVPLLSAKNKKIGLQLAQAHRNHAAEEKLVFFQFPNYTDCFAWKSHRISSFWNTYPQTCHSHWVTEKTGFSFSPSWCLRCNWIIAWISRYTDVPSKMAQVYNDNLLH